MTRIKICGITNLPDARAAVEAGADMLGFNFWPRSPRYIKHTKARKIIEELPPNISTVGVFVNAEHPAEVETIADEAGVGAVQLHGDESPDYCNALAGRYVIKVFAVGEGFEPQRVRDYKVSAIMLDALDRRTRGGTGRVIDWSIARQVRRLAPALFLAGGLSPENVAQAMEAANPDVVDACSSLEFAPGRKDHQRIQAFIAAVRKAAHG